MANIYFSIFIFAICTTASASASASAPLTTEDPTPTLWPEQFHSIVFANHSGQLQLIDFWYDWPNGRNFNIIRDQLSNTLSYSLEWNNGTSFFYDDSGDRRCSTLQLDIGIVRPNWLEGAHYLGKSIFDGFVCNVWEESQFVVYYEDVISHRPVHWLFNVGRATHTHIMTFEVGAVLDDAKWQVPSYCFENLDEYGKLSAKLNSNWAGYIAAQSANYVSLERFLDKDLTSIIES